ncbi:ABC transporter ATP-binding protein [Streptomyces blattellae]|uniref:ABC transporter ATP-binding protein n=1 Tax=Streptomyces blattellae TaxID=2569855 RepID=UPI0012B93E45|nr:ABC transporter ATP-binding protein [Streptomyces blattellae]
MNQAATERLLTVRDLRVEFPTADGTVRAVDNVSLDLGYGERLGIVGESGSGKSVLSRTIMGLTRSRTARVTGEVILDGRSVLDLSERSRRSMWGRDVAMVFQDPLSSLHPIMPIGEQIAEAVRRDASVTRREAGARAVQLLETVGVPLAAQRAKARAHELSGGMRQRVAIAMAIACRPKLIIADEPTTALDVTVQARILDLFDELCREFRIGLVMISHDLGVVGRHTDRIAVMYAGRIAERGPVAHVFARPAMRYTSALMAAIPRHDGARRTLPRPIRGLPPNLADPPAGCRFSPRCAHAGDACHEAAPALVEVEGEPGHEYACWHPGSDVTPPGGAGQGQGPAPAHPTSSEVLR